MKDNLTELVYIFDKSGSMYHLESDTIGGYNQMINEQKNQSGEAKVTTVLFNENVKTIVDRVDIQSVPEMTANDYTTMGCTAMLDAIGQTIDHIGEVLRDTPEEERPSKVIVTIVTDGAENSSKEYTYDRIKEMIELQQNKYNWTFIFIGANIDAVTTGQSMGINPILSVNYSATSVGTQSVYRSLSKATSMSRSADCCCTLDDVAETLNEGII